jgi:hypothetical protein
MTKSSYKNRKYKSLKDATDQLLNQVGGTSAASKLCRVQSTSLFSYSDESDDNKTRFMPVDIVEVLEQEADIPSITEYLSEKAGCLLWKIPKEEGSMLDVEIARTGQHAAHLFSDWAEFLGNDGVIDAEEAEKLLKDNVELVRTLMRMRTELEARIASKD